MGMWRVMHDGFLELVDCYMKPSCLHGGLAPCLRSTHRAGSTGKTFSRTSQVRGLSKTSNVGPRQGLSWGVCGCLVLGSPWLGGNDRPQKSTKHRTRNLKPEYLKTLQFSWLRRPNSRVAHGRWSQIPAQTLNTRARV